MREEFRLRSFAGLKCGIVVVEARYAKPFSVLMIHDDEGRVLRSESCPGPERFVVDVHS